MADAPNEQAQSLPALVRAKYPGVYDSLSDDELDAKVRAKYPGVYDSIPKPTAAPASPSVSEDSALERFASGAWKNINPTGLVSAAKHPIETAKALIEAQATQLDKAKSAYKEGRYSEAIGHLGATMLPLVGPAAANAGERIGSGDLAGGIGESVGLIGSVEAPRVIGAGVKGGAQLARSPLIGKLAKPAATMIGAKVGGPAGAVVGSAVGDMIADRIATKPPIEAPPIIAAPGVDRYMPNVTADPDISTVKATDAHPLTIKSAAELAEFQRLIKSGTPWQKAVQLIASQRDVIQRMGLPTPNTAADAVAQRNVTGAWK